MERSVLVTTTDSSSLTNCLAGESDRWNFLFHQGYGWSLTSAPSPAPSSRLNRILGTHSRRSWVLVLFSLTLMSALFGFSFVVVFTNRWNRHRPLSDKKMKANQRPNSSYWPWHPIRKQVRILTDTGSAIWSAWNTERPSGSHRTLQSAATFIRTDGPL